MTRREWMDTLLTGSRRGISGYLWLLKILIPISFATALLVHTGLLYKVDFLVQPAMGLLHLPAAAALPLIIGLFTGPYGAVGAMAAMDLTTDQMTLVAIFILISHNLIQESMVQGQSGFSALKAAGCRLLTSFIVTVTCAFLMGVAPPSAINTAGAAIPSAGLGFSEMLTSWSRDMAALGLQIFIIIMPLMILLEVMKRLDLIRYLVRAISPVLALMGLRRSTGMLWLTAAVFGITYGAAVIVEETRDHDYDPSELTPLHLSIGINHAMIEDPALFIPLGIPLVWLWIPRLAAAILAIYLLHFLNFVRRHHAERTGHKKFCDH